MTDLNTSCPTPEQLKALVDGSLPESDQSATQAHVDSCMTCQQVLESLVQGSESWDSALAHLRQEPVVTSETVLSEAMKQMKADEFVESGDSGWQSKRPLDFLTPSDQPGSIGKLGTYEVTDVIGQGGMGVVLRAFDPSLHRVVAVKVLAPYLAHNPQARKRFVREAQAIAAVSHDHVITIHAIDESAEQPKIVMQFVAGRSLQQKIDAEGSLDLKEILRIGMQTAAGLAAAHAQGLVHRDVKPSNILLENGIQRVKLTDFGLARAVDDASLTQSGAIAGTPQYMAPEQANGDAVDFRADLFSLGSVLYAMCVGHSPFRASTTMGVLKRVCHDPPRPIQELNTDIPDWLCGIVMKLLAKNPDDRFQSAKSVADLLEKWLAHVQQPTVVAKPQAVAETSTPAETASDSPEKPAQPQPVSKQQLLSARRDLDARTILFQPISGRWFLFSVLLGMSATLAVARMQGRVNLGEALIVSLMGGLFTSFWGLLFVSLVRLIWANVYGYIPWVSNSSKLDSTAEGFVESGTEQRRRRVGLPPESKALLAGIVAMIFGFNPFIAAIVAIIVWRLTKSKSDSTADESMESIDSFVGNSPQIADGGSWNRNDRVSGLLSRGRNLVGRAGNYVRSFFGPAASERNRILLAIGWWLVGGFDLFLLLFLWTQSQFFSGLFSGHTSTVNLMCFASFVMSLASFAISHCIYVRQNFGFVRSVSFLGLLPLTHGAIGRIPLGIVTLLWQNSPGVRESFEATPFFQTLLGRVSVGGVSFVRRSIGTASLAFLWTLIWAGLCVAAYWLLALPYGPSTYQVYDKARIKLKGLPNAQFFLTAKGFGAGAGLVPPANRGFIPDEVTLELADQNAPHRLKVRLGETVPINESTHQTLTKSEVEKCLSDCDGQNHRDHALDIFGIIERLNTGNGFALSTEVMHARSALSYAERMRISMESWRRYSSADVWRAWPGFTRISSMLDPELFEISPDNEFSRFELYPAYWFTIASALAAALFWLSICLWIIKRRHFPRTQTKPLTAALAS